jgi:hypothetical protein
VWDSSLGHNLANTGKLQHPFVEGFGGMHINFIQNRIVLPVFSAFIFKIAGYSIATIRLGSLIFGVLAIVSLYALISRWLDEKKAFWVALATMIHPWFFEVCRRARPEIYYTALGLAFLWTLIAFFDSRSRRTAFFSGVLMGLCCLTHPNGLILGFSILAAIVFWQRGRSTGRLILWGSLGVVLVILPYIFYVVWVCQNPQVSFWQQMQLSGWHRLFWKGEILRWKNFVKWPKGAPLAVIMVGSLVLGCYRSTVTEKVCVTVIALFALALSLASVSYTARYLVATVPFFSILMVQMIARLLSGKKITWPHWYKAVIICGVGIVVSYSLVCLSAIGLIFWRLRGADFNKVIYEVASICSYSDVFGAPVFYLGHNYYRYSNYIILYEGMQLIDAIAMVHKNKPEYAIRTAWTFEASRGLAIPPASMPPFRKDCLTDHICSLGTKIHEFQDPYYGPVEIYELDWAKFNY